MRRDEQATWWQGDREISAEDIVSMRTVAQRFPGLSRKELTYTLCEQLEWLTPAGRPKYTACAKLLARLEEAGELHLPAIRKDKSHPGPRPCAPRRASARIDPPAPLVRSLPELSPVRLRLASDAQDDSLWNDYVERYHPLGYRKRPAIGRAISSSRAPIRWAVFCSAVRPRRWVHVTNGSAGVIGNG